jgi:methionine aminopeptidase
LSILRPGMTTDEIDKKVHEFIISHDAYPTGIGFMGFPKSLCTSVNEGFLKINFYIKFFSCMSWYT